MKKNKDKKSWGGAREGSGSPKIETGRRINLILTEEEIRKAKAFGNGSQSDGIRKALSRVKIAP